MTMPATLGEVRRTDERGASAVEFALVVPFLLVLVFGVVQFGIVMAQKATVASAAREGARFGSVNLYANAMGTPRDCADVVAKARENATTLGMSPSQVAVIVKRGSSAGSATTRCSAAANATPSPAPALNDPPCKDAASTDILYVKTSFGAKLNIPLVANDSFALETTGASRCEYN